MARRGRSNGEEKFRITISPPARELQRMLEQLGKEALDFRPAWPTMISDVMAPGVRLALQTKGASLGSPWPPLSRRYARRKGGGEMLSKTGRLRSSLRQLRNARRSVSYGTKVPYARAVQYGHGRPFVRWSDEMKARARSVMQDHVTAVANRLASELEAKAKGA